MDQELAGKVAIVTGGSGLRRAMVELFVDHGAQVVIADVDEGRGDELAKGLGPTTAFRRTDAPTRTRSMRWWSSPSATSVASTSCAITPA